MRRRTVAGLVGGGAALALVVTLGIVWPGLDAQETPALDTSVWALRTGDSRQFARVNTTIGELDTVRSVTNPGAIAQAASGAYLFSESDSHLTRIDEAAPADLDDEAVRASPATPAGTVEVATSGEWVAYRTDAGAVWAGRLSGTAVQVDPFRDSGDEDAPQYTADAIAVDEEGALYAYSADRHAVLRYDVADAAVRGEDALDDDGLTAPAITAAGGQWVILDLDDGELRRRGADGVTEAPVGAAAVVSEPDPSGDTVYLADDTGLVAVATGTGAVTSVAGDGDAVLGTPARPVVHDGVVYAAWLPDGATAGTLWSSEGGTTPLDYGGRALGDDRRPVLVESPDAMIVNETRSGWVWTVPDGALVPSSQDWTLDDRLDPATVESDEQLTVVIDPKPPIAEPDAFGVRAGALVVLPVLLNDHDPNEDVLSIDPASVTGLDPGFGTLTLTDDDQRLAVRVAADAAGSATFSYAVTDGTAEGGLASAAASVTLAVVGAGTDSAPAWCGVERCLAEWPTPQVAPGGTITVPVLSGWVDPEGDPVLLVSVTNASGVGSVAATPTGDVVYQHADSGAGGDEQVELDVTVSDTTGQRSTKPLVVTVAAQPSLAVQSFAVVDAFDAGVTVDVAPHVTGTAGTVSLTGVRVLDEAAASATIVGGTTSFDLAAAQPGTYLVGFTVGDGVTDANGTARVTLVAPDGPAELATAPVVGFVHPQEDTTLDVLAAVANPTRRVLLVSDIRATADAGASLSVDAVGQDRIRVSGTTADGAPGRLGTVTYTVSDGTEDATSTVVGEATVYLLPPAPELAPIAVDDAIVVRAGAQVDIPVLDNDVSPTGGRPLLNPAAVTSSTPDALAFASGDVLRYLAPTAPGEYGVQYSVYSASSPALADTATVKVTVLDDEENRAPLPATLEGRVLSGGSTTIGFDGFGVDPDGDAVSLDRVVTQPASGSATVSADGASIVYASVPGFHGQVSFRYRTVDAFGETGEATVRVGVLDAESNPSPVTFTDYVQVQAGEDSSIRVSPLANDVDPTGGELVITDVRPDVAQTLADGTRNPVWTEQQSRLSAVGDTSLRIAAGTDPTTLSYLYDVESDSGNTARGLIVVRVVRDSVPDYPVVVDTALTIETRDRFPQGVDVLAGTTTWSGGEVDDLTVSLWGDPAGVAVEGDRLRGALPATTRIIPFAVTGEGRDGPVTTYAFLRVPGDDDLDLALRAGTGAERVTELESVSFDMAELVALARGSRIEVGDDVRASGARADATCSLEGGTTVRYDSGAGAPWADACQVPVRLAGEADWTYLSVPIIIQALDPQPELHPASLTVGPGETATFDLQQMTTWQLRDGWDRIAYAADYAGADFTVSLDGSILTVTGSDRAVPGDEEAAVVSVTSFDAVAPARLVLRVGEAPSTLPRGGTVAQACSQAAGSSCTIEVVGAGDEVNPLPRTALELVSVVATGACVGVSFEVASATAVRASWAADAPGQTCTASFQVQDAQGRPTNGDRDGRLTLDLRGFPKTPAALVQTAYADGTLTLRVDPGEAALAYPALTGFVVRFGGEVVARCDAVGTCPAIGAPNGEQRLYTATAVNEVGESAGSVQATGWAYDTPATPQGITWAPVVTGGEGGLVSLSIAQVDAVDTGSLEVSSPAGDTVTVGVAPGQTRVEIPQFRVGANTATTVTITPISRFSLPPGLGGATSGGAASIQANGVGAPISPTLSLSSTSNGDGTSTIQASAGAQANGDGSELRYAIVEQNRRCSPVSGGQSATFVEQDGQDYVFDVCVESWYGGQAFGRSGASASVRAVQSATAPTGFTFVVDPEPSVEAGQDRAYWSITETPSSSASPPRRNHAEFSGFPGSTVYGSDPGIQVRWVHDLWGTSSDPATVVPASGSAPYQVQANWSIDRCVSGGTLQYSLRSSNAASGAGATATWDTSGITYYAEGGVAIPRADGADPLLVPPGAVRVEGLGVTADWGAVGWALDPASDTLSARCN